MCITDGMLRAQLDDELTEAESRAVQEHLATCQDCQRRAEALTARSERASALFSTLANSADEAAITDPQFALARFKTRRASAVRENRSLFNRFFAGRLRTAWGALAVLGLVAIIGFSPSRAWAEKLLELFRVKQITVVSLDTNQLRFGDLKFEKRISQLLSRDMVVTKEPGEPQMARSAEEASALAGFKVRLPGGRTDAPQLKVEGEYAFNMTVDRSRLQTIFNEAGRSDLQLPAALDGARVGVDIPKATIAVYGDWPKAGPAMARQEHVDWSKCLALAQVPSPSVTTPPDLNVSQVAEMGLQLAGMSPEQAHNFSQTVDWTSTLVIPIPQDAASFQTVEVAGYTLLWVKNGIIYSMTGFGDSSQAVPLAESLR
jgi:hypothetical protein